MHLFLRKSLLALASILVVAGLSTSLWIYAFQRLASNEASQRAAVDFLQLIRQDLFEQNAQILRQLQGVVWYGELIDALDRDNPPEALQKASDYLQQVGLNAKLLALFDFEADPMISSHKDMEALLSELSQYLKEQSAWQHRQTLFQWEGQVYQFLFFEIGGSNKAAGYLAVAFHWLPASLQSVQHSISFHDQDDPVLLGSTEFSPKAGWTYQLKDANLSVNIPLSHSNTIMRIQLTDIKLPLKKAYETELFLVVPGIILLLGIFAYSLTLYLYKQTFLPLDRLYLFIVMLRDRNRYQKRPGFQKFPLIRRIADEVLDYLKAIEGEKRSWQQKYHELRKGVECAKDLALLGPWEVRIWSSSSSRLLHQMLVILQELKSAEREIRFHELGSIWRLNRTLFQYQVFFGLHGFSRSVSKLHNFLSRLGEQEKLIESSDLDAVEQQLYEFLEQLELYNEVRTEWQGYRGTMDQEQFSLSVIDRSWQHKAAQLLQKLNAGDESQSFNISLFHELSSLLNQLDHIPWPQPARRLESFCIEYGQMLGKFPPRLTIQGDVASISGQAMNLIYPFLIEALGFLIEFSLEDRRARLRAGKAEQGSLSVSILPQDSNYQIVCCDDGQHLPIKEALAELVPSGGFKLDEISEDECWDLFNKIHLEGFAKDSGAPAYQLRFLIQLLARCRSKGCNLSVKGQSKGGLIITMQQCNQGIAWKHLEQQTAEIA